MSQFKPRHGMSDTRIHYIHRTVEELLALTFQIYCRPGQR